MKILLPLLIVFLFTGDTSKVQFPENRIVAKCYGYSPCNACSNCTECKHCNAGGTCGVCAKVKPDRQPDGKKSPDTKEPANQGQCKAITKKGTRCSRSSRSGGYCWQHGG